ncbi:MAG: hypothetical protein ABJC19_04385 [Gemmatimonadota bacterium]
MTFLARATIALGHLVAMPLVAQSGGIADSLPRLMRVEALVQQRLHQDAGKLWGARLDTIPLLLTDGTRAIASRDPRQPAFERATGGWFVGDLPKGMVVANTSVSWAGRRWAMIRLPLPEDTTLAIRLVIHERWHAIQPDVLPLPKYNQFDAGAALLDHPDGRIWLRLEWRALAAALRARPGSRDERTATVDAIAFRARRYALATPAERERERLLDLDEGMPEYTAWRLSNSSAAALSEQLQTAAPAATGFGRSFQYYTGPAYGYLLDRRSARWRAQLRTQLDVQGALAELLGRDRIRLGGWLNGTDSVALAKAAERSGGRYGLHEVRAEELQRWQAMEQRLALLRVRYLDGPTLRLRPKLVNISFDPNLATTLGDSGTVYGTLSWKGPNDAVLDASSGAFVNATWSELRVPLDAVRPTAGVLAEVTTWRGEGWTLTLPVGWRVEALGESWVLTPP